MADGTISYLTDAKGYVDSVIQSPLFVKCTSESKCYTRKRHLSESNLLDDSDVCVKSRRVVQQVALVSEQCCRQFCFTRRLFFFI
jgi:hypothetical protein